MIAQIAAITLSNLRSLPQRLGASTVIVLGIAGVVGVIVSIFAVAMGFQGVMTATGQSNRYMILAASGFSNTEAYSFLPRDAVAFILQAPGIAHDAAGSPIASAEAFRAVRFDAPNGRRMSGMLRGVSAANAQLRPEFRIVEGRMAQTGLHELVAGVGLCTRMGLKVGSLVHLRDTDWLITGIFATGDSHESELIGDVESVLSVIKATVFQSVTARVDTPADLAALKAALAANPSLKIKVMNEPDYYRLRFEDFGSQLTMAGFIVGGIMALGALFGALNTMYAAVAARLREIAMLRAVGFAASVVVASLFIEALLLALSGGVIGAAVAALLFDGRTVSTPATSDTGSDSLLTYAVTVTPGVLGSAILVAAGVGLLGALFPAIRAARLPIATALQVK